MKHTVLLNIKFNTQTYVTTYFNVFPITNPVYAVASLTLAPGLSGQHKRPAFATF